MIELTNEELDNLLEYVAEAMFILQDEQPGNAPLFPSCKGLALLKISQTEAGQVENKVLQLLLCMNSNKQCFFSSKRSLGSHGILSFSFILLFRIM